MILDGNQRGSCMEMARHLLNGDENDHVEVFEVRGFLSDDIMGAMKEVDAVCRGTRALKPLFSVSFSPPPNESVRIETFETALARVEERHGLTGQPRVVVFHEKNGRRHCHAVWSRIDADTMTAIPLPFFKMKLRDVSREMFIENGWRMPRGLMNSQERDLRNFTLDQWQQAKRIGTNAAELRQIMQECYAVSDTRQAFAKALEERGLYLAKGDRRGHVAVTYEGEVLSVARYTGRKAKEIEARLGSADDLPTVDETRAYIANLIAPKLETLRDQADADMAGIMVQLQAERVAMKTHHKGERQRLDAGLAARQAEEDRTRAERFRAGVKGVFDRLTGRHARIRKQNELEAWMALQRDREQRHVLVSAQLAERRELQRRIADVRQRYAYRVVELHRDLTRQLNHGLQSQAIELSPRRRPEGPSFS